MKWGGRIAEGPERIVGALSPDEASLPPTSRLVRLPRSPMPSSSPWAAYARSARPASQSCCVVPTRGMFLVQASHRPALLEQAEYRGTTMALTRDSRLSRGRPRPDPARAWPRGRRLSAGYPSGASDRCGHQYGHRHQPGHVCRTQPVRTAVVPEAADGQSADSCQLRRGQCWRLARPGERRLRRGRRVGRAGRGETDPTPAG